MPSFTTGVTSRPCESFTSNTSTCDSQRQASSWSASSHAGSEAHNSCPHPGFRIGCHALQWRQLQSSDLRSASSIVPLPFPTPISALIQSRSTHECPKHSATRAVLLPDPSSSIADADRAGSHASIPAVTIPPGVSSLRAAGRPAATRHRHHIHWALFARSTSRTDSEDVAHDP